MREVLLQDVHFSPVGVCPGGVRGGAVLADVVGLDVGGVEAIKGLDGGRHGLGGLVLLGGGYGVDSRGEAQGRPL